MKEYLEIQKPELDYTYEFETDQLSLMSECVEAHGFAIIKDVLSPDLVESVKQAVFDGTDPERELEPGQSSTRHAWIESGPGAWQLMGYEPFMKIHRHLIGAKGVDHPPICRYYSDARVSTRCMAHGLVRIFNGYAEKFRRCPEPRTLALRQMVLPDGFSSGTRWIMCH